MSSARRRRGHAPPGLDGRCAKVNAPSGIVSVGVACRIASLIESAPRQRRAGMRRIVLHAAGHAVARRLADAVLERQVDVEERAEVHDGKRQQQKQRRDDRGFEHGGAVGVANSSEHARGWCTCCATRPDYEPRSAPTNSSAAGRKDRAIGPGGLRAVEDGAKRAMRQVLTCGQRRTAPAARGVSGREDTRNGPDPRAEESAAAFTDSVDMRPRPIWRAHRSLRPHRVRDRSARTIRQNSPRRTTES